jgi:hypothetical protein
MLDVIAIPEALRDKLGPEGARALVDLFNRTARATREEVVLLAEERFARRLAESETRLDRRIAEQTATLWQAISYLEARVSHGLTVQTRWIAGLWVAQTGLLAALLSLFLS